MEAVTVMSALVSLGTSLHLNCCSHGHEAQQMKCRLRMQQSSWHDEASHLVESDTGLEKTYRYT